MTLRERKKTAQSPTKQITSEGLATDKTSTNGDFPPSDVKTEEVALRKLPKVILRVKNPEKEQNEGGAEAAEV